MPVIEIQDGAHFNELIENNQVVIIDAWAEWHGPCKAISPIFEQLSNHENFNKSGVVFAKLNVDDVIDVARELGATALPTFYTFHNGIQFRQVNGAASDKLQVLVAEATGLV